MERNSCWKKNNNASGTVQFTKETYVSVRNNCIFDISPPCLAMKPQTTSTGHGDIAAVAGSVYLRTPLLTSLAGALFLFAAAGPT